ncbi:hypothetical protein MLD38_009997 [Melastoma candidum]|uniref:Uncharacterized protein n=1 Tax=Melastoma candidum TaxID=119954 RepID=A0ACB9QXN4_9MYRT|nr:hypothetical protein MLD38_009997 [Melastoma candidum]
MVLHENMLAEVKRQLGEARGRGSMEVLAMVDALQRLAIDRHFRNEVKAALEEQCTMYSACGDLHEQVLRFRMLRQEGYNVPLDISRWFDIVESVACGRAPGRDDILGLASLHEASHLCTEGEDILERVGEIVCQKLNVSLSMITDHKLAKFVRDTLRNPVHKSIPRLASSNNIRDDHLLWSNYGWNSALQELALLDSSLVKFKYHEEFHQVTKWWNDLGLGKELKFARDNLLKWYMWTIVAIDNPNLSKERVELTKPISFVYIIDDIFDVYGTLDELVLFTDSIIGWSPHENLPEYMKVCFQALNNITNEISDEVYQRHGWNPLISLRKSWARLVEAFLVEARWFTNGTCPAADDYLQNAIVSSGVPVVLVHVFFLLGEGITEKNIDILDGLPGVVSSPATILRLWDDLGSASDEDQDGNDGSYVEYYKKEHPGCTDASARAHVEGLIAKEWKKLNRECLLPREFPNSFCKACLNAARMVPLMYDYNEDHSLPLLKEHMDSMLFSGQASRTS